MINVGIVGTGLMGEYHARAWAQTAARLVGMTSLDPARDQQLCAQYGGQPFASLAELLDAVDVIDICTPTHLHHPMVLQAAQAGKHIVCEKPLGRTAQQVDEMVTACRQAGVKLLVAQVVRFFPEYAQAQQISASGALGRIGVVRLKRVSSGPSWGDNWFADFAKSGGMILDLMVHDFDYARWVAGEVESVYAQSVRGRSPDAPTDYALAILRHTSGALSHVEGGWAYPPPLFRTALEIAGELGLIEHPAESSNPLSIRLKDAATGPAMSVPRSPLLEDPYVTEIKHFYQVLAHDAPSRVAPEDGAAAVKIALAAMESVRTGRRVALEEVR